MAALAMLTASLATWILGDQLATPRSEYTFLWSFTEQIPGEFGLLSDSLSIVAAWIVCVITAIANCYSIGYVKKNLAVFLLAMNALAMNTVLLAASANLLQMHIFWTVLTLLSYFLLTFNPRGSPVKSSTGIVSAHAFGDLGFTIAIIALFQIFGNFNFGEKFFIGNDLQLRRLEFVALAILTSIFFKSAQLGSTRWLCQTPEASMPAQSLIHSATLLTAGIFPLIRLQNVFECSELVQNTMILGGLGSMTLYSIKAVFAEELSEILAYSSIAQVGALVVAGGFSAYGAMIIMYVSHAFSKSALIFSMGSVVYSLSGEQKLSNMGGLFELLPKTYISSILTVISMVGVPLMSFYYSRKVLLNEIASANRGLALNCIAVGLVVVAAILTSAYLFRMIYLIFHGKRKLTETSLAYLNENDNFIIFPQYIAVFFAIFSGVFFYYALYVDLIWTDVFAFSYGAVGGYAIFTFVTVNLIGIAVAALICKAITPRNISIQLNYKGIDKFKKHFIHIVQNLDRKYFRKVYLLIAGSGRSNHAGR
ncbi:MAG: hypothetical protein LBG20_02330 [Holosporaceae bacterium]|nr:hypothetical protein [Holosporaceae bacterium]